MLLQPIKIQTINDEIIQSKTKSWNELKSNPESETLINKWSKFDPNRKTEWNSINKEFEKNNLIWSTNDRDLTEKRQETTITEGSTKI